jgi:mannonate dehydratase
MRRRELLALGLAAPLLGSCRFSAEDGLMNACLTAPGIAREPLVHAAWNGLDPAKVWDTHVHLFGNGRGEKGVHIDPAYDADRSPVAMAR